MSLGNIEKGTDGIKKQAKELIEQAYLRGYKAGRASSLDDWIKTVDVNDLVEKGRNEAWEAARKIILDIQDGGMSCDELESIFWVQSFYKNLLKTYNASEAISKIKAYEEQKKKEKDSKIHIGDEVEFVGTDTKGIVISNKTTHPHILVGDYITQLHVGDLIPTGRHFPEIAEVLKKLEGGQVDESSD